MKGNTPPQSRGRAVESPIVKALTASKAYRDFRFAFRELTGFRIGLGHPGSLPERAAGRSFKVELTAPGISSAADVRLAAYSRQSNKLGPKAAAAAFKLLQVFAKHLTLICTQVILPERKVDNPLIQRAKVYIEENHTADLSLASVTKLLGVSRFYFCKLFKKGTGRTLSTYVIQVRIERAKRLLLNPNARISEIAFEAGFQSLTHFNRAFRRMSGCSPTEYRKRLPPH